MKGRDRAFAEVPIERVRDYWNDRPCNVRHSPQPVGTREYYDEVEARKYLVEPHIPAFADFEQWSGRQVLEIGCGIGTDTINFARAGAEVTVIELSERSLELAQQRAELFGLSDRITFRQGNAETLTSVVPAKAYDLVYSFGVIHHTPHPDKVLAEIRSLATPSTVVKLMVYHRWSWKVAEIVFGYGKGRFWRARSLIAEHSEAQTGSPVTYAYSRGEFARLLEQQGFSVTDLFVDHIFPYKVSDYVNYVYTRRWYFRWLPKAAFRLLERRFGWHLCVTARPNATA